MPKKGSISGQFKTVATQDFWKKYWLRILVASLLVPTSGKTLLPDDILGVMGVKSESIESHDQNVNAHKEKFSWQSRKNGEQDLNIQSISEAVIRQQVMIEQLEKQLKELRDRER